MSIWALILVIILTFGSTWVVLSCLWAAEDRRADREEDDTDDGEDI